jgi:hypothetical protein
MTEPEKGAPPSASNVPAVPAWVPREMLAELDLSELAGDDPSLREECSRLGSLLGANVAAYRKDARGAANGLCSYYLVKHLRPHQMRELTRAETRFPDVVFVAYRSPLERLNGRGLPVG